MTNPEITIELNYSEKLEKLKKVLSSWNYRRLTLFGKITVLKSLIASQLVYILAPLPTNHHALKEINSLFYDFLWSGKGDKIKRDVMINDYANGGLNMIDINSFSKSLEIISISKIMGNGNFFLFRTSELWW